MHSNIKRRAKLKNFMLLKDARNRPIHVVLCSTQSGINLYVLCLGGLLYVIESQAE